jgi:hypothetical protein
MSITSRCIAGLVLIAASAAPATSQILLPKPTIVNPTTVTVVPTFGRYRVVVQGIAVASQTVDTDKDGRRDEVYVAAAFVLWNRKDGHLISNPDVVRTVEYGDISGKNSGRVAAGSASPQGGLWGGNGGDYAPSGFTASSTSTAGASSGALPLLVFEGGLSDSTEALLLAPSIWESDGIALGYNTYVNSWKTGGVGHLIGSPVVQNQLGNSSLTSLVVPADPTLQTAATAINVFAPFIGMWVLQVSSMTPTLMDRPIGLTEYQNTDQYQDRVTVITHEKLVSLPVGGGVSLTIPFAEPMNGKLNGLYQLFVRVERVQ